jgi:hypothetical protein
LLASFGQNHSWVRLAKMRGGAFALMLRSIAAHRERRRCHRGRALRCVSKHEGATHRPVLILRDARTQVRVCGTSSACALLRMRPDIESCTVHHVKQPISFPRPHCCVRALPLCFAHPNRGAERRSGACEAPVGHANDAACQALARRLASRRGTLASRRSTVAVLGSRGRASLTEHPPAPKLRPASGSVTASSSQPGRSAWRARPLPPEATVASRRRRTPLPAPPSGCLRRRPSKSEDANLVAWTHNVVKSVVDL